MNNIEHDAHEAEFYDDSGQLSEEAKAKALFDNLKSVPDSYIAVFRQPNGGNKPMEFVCRVDADEYDIGQLQAFVQSNYGGGVYRFMGYSNDKLRVNRKVNIASPANRAPVSQDSSLQTILVQMERMQQQILSLLQQPKGDVADLRKGFLEEMKTMRELFGAPAGQSTGMDGILTVVQGLKSLGINVGLPSGDGDGGGDGFSNLLEKAMPLFTAIASRPAVVAQVPVHVQQRQNMQKQPANLEAPKKPIKQEEKNMMSKEERALHQGIGLLVSGAKNGADPAEYAELVLNNVEPSILEPMFTDPNAVENLGKINADVLIYREWFIDLGEHIKACLGLESKFIDLYEGDEADSLNQSDELSDEDAREDNLHNAGDTGR